MSDLSFAQKDPAVVLEEALAVYKTQTGVTLGAADPRRLHLQALLLLLSQIRALVDFSGKQNLLRYVSAQYIEELVALIGGKLIPAGPSTTTLRFTAITPGILTIPAGRRATDGTHIWAVKETTVSAGGASYVDALAECTVTGRASNGVVAGQIVTLVDSIANIASVSNTTTTKGGRDVEGTEAFRERARSIPESSSTGGPGIAYEALARSASTAVADAVALGPDDGANMDGAAPDPCELLILLIEGERDDAGVVTSVIPDPSTDLITTVTTAVTDEKVRVLTDSVSVSAPVFVDIDITATYYIARSRSDFAAEIQAAAEDAFAAYRLWQESKIGRDVNPSKLTADIVVAGAKRLVVTEPAYAALKRDQCARVGYATLTFGGIEDD